MVCSLPAAGLSIPRHHALQQLPLGAPTARQTATGLLKCCQRASADLLGKSSVLLLLLLAAGPVGVGAQPAGSGKQNQGGGLVGEIFGAGTPGNGNGMDHAWDGQTSTWFDCLGPPDDFWDSCYTGIKLATPTAIGQIRFCETRISPIRRACDQRWVVCAVVLAE